jgi:hypothetical protein
MPLFRWVTPLALAAGFSSIVTVGASAMPAFARRYNMSCQICHNPFPKLTAFGEDFAANGYRLAGSEEPRDTVATGDPLLALMKDIPLAIRLDLYAQGYADGKAATDFQTPYGLKLLSGGPISKKISYFFYTFLVERGDLGGVEDAFLHFNDLGGAPLDLIVGQFQVSDPIFKRELRLEFEDYAIYRARLGAVPVDLTYDRGLMASVDVAGFTMTGEIVNGSGIGSAQANRRFDIDTDKNFMLHLTRDLGGALRLGGLGYYGRSFANVVPNRTTMIGADATVTLGILELNGQFVHRHDDEPTFTAGEPGVNTDGGFGELILRPVNSRFYGYSLYNYMTASRPLLDVREGGPGNVSRYQTVAGGLGYLAQRNFRVMSEIAYDLEQDSGRLTLGLNAAF